MRNFLFYLSAIAFVFVSACNPSGEKPKTDTNHLYKGFLTPPQEAKPTVYFTLLNGYMNKEFIQEELKQYAEKGVGGLLVFDIGILGKKDFFPPQGSEFMSDEWLDNFAYIVKTCDDLGMSVELAGVSSWDMGGSWTPPEEAVLALFKTNATVTGPKKVEMELEYPELPETAILDKDGKPIISEEVAILAIPVKKRQEAYEFVYKLDNKPALHQLDYVILANTDKTNKEIIGGQNIFTKDFAVEVSTTDEKNSSFNQVLKASLLPNADDQKFELPEGTKAKYVRLKILNGHNTKSDYVQLAKFRVFNTEGEDIIGRPYNKRFGGGMEVRINSQLGSEKKWKAKNLNIKEEERTGEVGESWISNGKQPVLIENIDDIQILTEKFQNGVLTWDVPEGEWEIVRYVLSNTGEKLKIPNPASDGYATDHLSAKATRNHISYITGRLEKKFGDLKISSVDNIYLPSYEVVGLLWTYDLPEQFRSYRNYDLIKYIPALTGYTIVDEETTDRFLYDYQRTMGDLLIDAFYITANKTAHERGMAIKSESAGPGPPIHNVPVESLRSLNSIDAMQGEFWPWREHWDGLWVVKEVASASHIYGENKIVHMESFTGFRHWQDGPVDLKPSADRAFCEGMNHIVWHMAEHTPPEAGKPGWAYHAGTHFSVNLVWWNQMDTWIDYLTRTSYMLQQGLFVGDVVYYYGNKGANFIQPKYTNTALDDGYDYDVTNLEVMMNRMDVKDGKIILPDGISYEVLILPNNDDVSLTALKRIKELAEKGATIIGNPFKRSAGLYKAEENDAAVKQLVAELWGNIDGEKVFENKVGIGRVISAKKSVNDVLAEKGITYDFSYEGKDVDLDYIHRRTATEEIYFVRNEKDKAANFMATFRVKNKTPEIWLPDSGEKIPMLAYEVSDKGITIDMKLDKHGSAFVVFTDGEAAHVNSVKGKACVRSIESGKVKVEAYANGKVDIKAVDGKTHSANISNIPENVVVKGEWTMEFLNKGFGGPEQPIQSELKSYTTFEEKGIKFYSGEVKYTNTVSVDAANLANGNKVYLDLSDLWLTGDVTVNGQFIGTLWKAPYIIDVTKAIKSGENKLEIVIANTWSNRLAGDARFPDEKQYTSTNIDGKLINEDVPFDEMELRESGLFGPVKLVFTSEVEIEM